MSRGVFVQSEDKAFEVIFRKLRQEDEYSSLSFDGEEEASENFAVDREEEGYAELARNPEYIAEQEQRREARSFGGETENEPAVEEEVTEEAPVEDEESQEEATEEAPAEEVTEEDEATESEDEPVVEEDAPADDNVDTDASDAEDADSSGEDADSSGEGASEFEDVYLDVKDAGNDENLSSRDTDNSGYLITGEPGYGTVFQAKQEAISEQAVNEPAWDEPVSVEDDVDETVDADAESDADAETAETAETSDVEDSSDEDETATFEAVTVEGESLNKAPLAEYELPVEYAGDPNATADTVETGDSEVEVEDTGVEAEASSDSDFDEDAFTLDYSATQKNDD